MWQGLGSNGGLLLRQDACMCLEMRTRPSRIGTIYPEKRTGSLAFRGTPKNQTEGGMPWLVFSIDEGIRSSYSLTRSMRQPEPC
jgi:hypothetical protein